MNYQPKYRVLLSIFSRAFYSSNFLTNIPT